MTWFTEKVALNSHHFMSLSDALYSLPILDRSVDVKSFSRHIYSFLVPENKLNGHICVNFFIIFMPLKLFRYL